MEAIIFIGIQATGKSSFYQSNFFNSHVRISLDLLNTRNKERRFLNTCFDLQTRFVVDNTNPTLQERAKYIHLAREHHYHVVGYYFSSSLEEALARNNARVGKAKIPEIGIKSCYSKLEPPTYQEGFDKLYDVRLENNEFIVEDWKNEV